MNAAAPETTSVPLRFNRLELAGSLGDLGTLLPLAIGMILINGLNPMGVFFSVGLVYLMTGLYFRVTCPVEPMKVISAYAIATGVTATQIQASCLITFVFLILIGATGLITVLSRLIPKPVVRGVQLSTGLLLASQGVKLMIGTSQFQQLRQAAEPYLSLQSLGPIPLGLLIGIILAGLTLFLLNNKRLPAALVVVGAGLLVGMFLGTGEGLDAVRPGLNLPTLMPYGFPANADFTFALLVLVIPQVPMTIGNAVIATSDLSRQYFPQEGGRVTPKGLCISMAFANLLSFLVGGMALCHGAGGLASRYCFGARTGGSNLIIGLIFIVLAILMGQHILSILFLFPMSALGVLLVFAGLQLCLSMLDITVRKDLFVAASVVGITLASNLAVGFVVGAILAYVFRSEKFNV
ncbi:putative sulfate/molybdate transporter [Desulfonatronum thioautotrophicum]|uniref:putative sulfate/molybdate transporter n=1 Tax=Desulfonatronum thioautotrophicum TaxID=617001 RepID=UPI0005EADDA4|nr:putative sulfate/molybdate transporter [Desulfonatronum thioautotrophicum]